MLKRPRHHAYYYGRPPSATTDNSYQQDRGWEPTMFTERFGFRHNIQVPEEFVRYVRESGNAAKGDASSVIVPQRVNKEESNGRPPSATTDNSYQQDPGWGPEKDGYTQRNKERDRWDSDCWNDTEMFTEPPGLGHNVQVPEDYTLYDEPSLARKLSSESSMPISRACGTDPSSEREVLIAYKHRVIDSLKQAQDAKDTASVAYWEGLLDEVTERLDDVGRQLREISERNRPAIWEPPAMDSPKQDVAGAPKPTWTCPRCSRKNKDGKGKRYCNGCRTLKPVSRTAAKGAPKHAGPIDVEVPTQTDHSRDIFIHETLIENDESNGVSGVDATRLKYVEDDDHTLLLSGADPPGVSSTIEGSDGYRVDTASPYDSLDLFDALPLVSAIACSAPPSRLNTSPQQDNATSSNSIQLQVLSPSGANGTSQPNAHGASSAPLLPAAPSLPAPPPAPAGPDFVHGHRKGKPVAFPIYFLETRYYQDAIANGDLVFDPPATSINSTLTATDVVQGRMKDKFIAFPIHVLESNYFQEAIRSGDLVFDPSPTTINSTPNQGSYHTSTAAPHLPGSSPSNPANALNQGLNGTKAPSNTWIAFFRAPPAQLVYNLLLSFFGISLQTASFVTYFASKHQIHDFNNADFLNLCSSFFIQSIGLYASFIGLSKLKQDHLPTNHVATQHHYRHLNRWAIIVGTLSFLTSLLGLGLYFVYTTLGVTFMQLGALLQVWIWMMMAFDLRTDAGPLVGSGSSSSSGP